MLGPLFISIMVFQTLKNRKTTKMSKKGTMVIMKEHEHEGPMNEELKALEAHMLSVSKQG